VAFLHNKSLRRATLLLLTIWSAGSFWFFSQSLFINVIITFVAACSLYLIWTEISPLFILIFLTFTSSFALYGFLFFLNLPLWIIMIFGLLVFGYLFTFFEQKVDVLAPEQAIYLDLFALIISETFIFVSYYLISPLNRSLIISLVAYILAGFCLSIVESKNSKKFLVYLTTFVVVLLLIVITAPFGII
jgi:hypothetical protein